MSERNPESLTRVPRQPSAGTLPGIEPEQEITPEQALAQAQEAQRRAEEERDAARSREQALARERDEARAREYTAAGAELTARERSILSGIETQTSNAEQAKKDIAIAQAAGDAIAVADAFDRLADSRSKLGRLTEQKDWFDSERERIARQPPPQQQQPSNVGIEVQTPGGTLRVSADVKSWMDRHSRFYNDNSYYNHAITAHQAVVGDGIREGSPAYFRALDDAMTKYEKFEAFDRGELQQQESKVRQLRPNPATTGAPVSRETGPPRSRSSEPDARAIAQRLGVTEQDLRDFARVNGYKGEDGYRKYLAEHQVIADLERAGERTGLVVDSVYR